MKGKNMSTKSITIPMSLARILVAEPEDMKNEADYDNVKAVGKSLLALLLSTSEVQLVQPKRKRQTNKKVNKGITGKKWTNAQRAKFIKTMKKKWASQRAEGK